MLCQIVAKTDVGRQRLRNEDNYLVLAEYELTVIADGMGGHVDGNIASQIAVDTFKDRYAKLYDQVCPKSLRREELVKTQELFMVESVQLANKNIFNRNKANLGLEGMGTTVVALQVCEGYALIAWVGDSRLYLYRNKKLSQISQDHSLVGELVRYNIIDKKDLVFLQNKNIITRALGMADNVLVDTLIQKTAPDDIFLLCSDGLTDLLTDEQMEEIITDRQGDLYLTVNALVDEANNRGGQDNISVSLVKIQ